MSTTLGIVRRKSRARMGIGMPGDNNRILEVARRLRRIVDAPVLGGIAVYLHGGGRSIPLDKRFAAKLPKAIRAEFKAMVSAVRVGEQTRPNDRRF